MVDYTTVISPTAMDTIHEAMFFTYSAAAVFFIIFAVSVSAFVMGHRSASRGESLHDALGVNISFA